MRSRGEDVPADTLDTAGDAKSESNSEENKEKNKEEPPFASILSEGWSESPYSRPKWVEPLVYRHPLFIWAIFIVLYGVLIRKSWRPIVQCLEPIL